MLIKRFLVGGMSELTSSQEALAVAISDLYQRHRERGLAGIWWAALLVSVAVCTSLTGIGSHPDTSALATMPAIPFTLAVAGSARKGGKIGAAAAVALSLAAMFWLNVPDDMADLIWLVEDGGILAGVAWCVSAPRRQKPPHQAADKRQPLGVVGKRSSPFFRFLSQRIVG